MDYIDNKYQLTPGDYRVTNVTPFTYRDGYTYPSSWRRCARG